MMGIKSNRLSAATAAVAACGVLTLAGCGDSSGGDAATGTSASQAASAPVTVPKTGIVDFETPKPGSGSGLKLGFIALDDSIPFSKLVTDSMRRNAAAAGAQLIVCDSQGDGQRALACARSLRSQKVDAYLNYQVDQDAAAAVCAAGPDVPVIAVTVEQKPCQVARMGAANEYAGYLAGRAMAQYAKSKWNCDYDAYVSIEVPATGNTNTERMGGYRKGFRSVCPGELKNERVIDAATLDDARTKMTDTLTALPGQHRIIVVGLNDDGILGARAAARTAGRQDDIYTSGQGADRSSWCEIKTDPHWIADTAYLPERYGEIGIPYLIKLAKGETIPPLLLVKHELVTGENIDRLYHPEGC
jgi:ribose transport system substrate-binding protein